jgi:hypothetical protein
MGNREKASGGGREAEPFLSNARPGIHINPGTQDGVGEAGVRANPAIGAEHDPRSDGGVWADLAASADLRPGFDKRKRSDLGGGINACTLSYESRWMSAGAGRGDWVEQPSNPGPSRVGRVCDDWYGSGWHPCEHVRVHDHCPSRGLLQCFGIAPVVQETYFVSICRYQRGNARELQINLWCGTEAVLATVARE